MAGGDIAVGGEMLHQDAVVEGDDASSSSEDILPAEI